MIHTFNGFTCNMRRPFKMKTGTVCTLVESDQGLILIDTGPGLEDYAHPHGILRFYKTFFDTPCDTQEAAINQVNRLGYHPEDVRHIVLTHMHFDHCGGLPDFPWAKVHVHRKEYEMFTGGLHGWKDSAYVRRHVARVAEWSFYETGCEKWYDFNAARLPFEPEMWLVELHGHSEGHCGVAVKTSEGWYFNAADAGAVYNNNTPAWLIKLVLGPCDAQLRRFMKLHPEIQLVNSHMWLDWFAKELTT